MEWSRPLRDRIVVAVLLAALTAAVYGQVATFDFINHDDPDYVSENPVIRRGLSLEGIRWAFTSVEMANWHPLTWLSHMADVQFFGLNPGAHHLVSLLFHLLNTVLLFALLHDMTGALGRSAFVAAIFALHPLHVESVAWIAERKDVLSTFFGFLSLWAYVRYVRRPGAIPYLVSLILFALGLTAKPMLVTLPVVLLLLDAWPLRRLSPVTETGAPPGPERREQPKKKKAAKRPDRAPARGSGRSAAVPLVSEKVPFFLLAAVSSLVTLFAQRTGGAVVSLQSFPLTERISNAIVTYVLYLWKAVWPLELSVFYPIQAWPPAVVLACAVLLAAVTFAAVRWARPCPYVPVGWFWYLVTLLPVIGIIKVGDAAMSDRYTYISLLGPFMALSWGAVDLAGRWSFRKAALPAAAAVVLAACAVLTVIQVGTWRSSALLFSHALAVTKNNFMAHNNLAAALIQGDRLEEALGHLRQSVAINPGYAFAHHNLGTVFSLKGRDDEALAEFEQAVRLNPGLFRAYFSMANIQLSRGRADEAIDLFRRSTAMPALRPQANAGIADALLLKQRDDEALRYYLVALEQEPDNPKIQYNVGVLLARRGRVDEAIGHLREAVRLRPDYARAHNNLGSALLIKGKVDEAITHFEEALRIDPDYRIARENLRDAQAQQKKGR